MGDASKNIKNCLKSLTFYSQKATTALSMEFSGNHLALDF
jgi:hypothetical protein